MVKDKDTCKIKIVIVDDSKTNCVAIQKFLTIAGFEDTTYYLSASEAIANIDETVDLVLMDITMPEMDGIEATKILRERFSDLELPVIIVSALDQGEYIETAFAAGANDYISKPVKRVELVARVRTICALRNEYRRKLEHERILEKIIIKQQEQKFQMESELELAKQLQESFLAPNLQTERLSIEGTLIASERLSGDFYYWMKIDENKYGVIIIDIMGHGVAAALISMSLRSLLPGIIGRVQDPLDVMEELNKHMYRLFQDQKSSSGEVDHYFTAIYALIDLAEATLEYVNAGHPYGLIIRADETLALLDAGSPPIGIFEKIPMEKGQVDLAPADRIFLYTDGFMEFTVAAGHRAELDASDYLLAKNKSAQGLSFQTIHRNIRSEARIKRPEDSDDISFLMLEIGQIDK